MLGPWQVSTPLQLTSHFVSASDQRVCRCLSCYFLCAREWIATPTAGAPPGRAAAPSPAGSRAPSRLQTPILDGDHRPELQVRRRQVVASHTQPLKCKLYRPRRSEPDDVGEDVALRPAAHSVVRPSLKPSDASMKSPASSIIKLSMKPKPTMGSADMSASCPPSGAARRAPPCRRPMRATPARDSPRWFAPRRATPAARQGSPR